MTTTNLYAATEPFITRSTDTPANQQFSATLEASLRVDRSITSRQLGFGGFTESISELTLINADAEYDALAAGFSINGRPIVCSIGQMSTDGKTVSAFAMFERFAVLTGERMRLDRSRLTIEMRDPSMHMLVPVQDRVYPGNGSLQTGNIEDGTDNVAGKRRPRAEGTVFNATGSLVVPEELVYQISDGYTTFAAVKDGGVELQFQAAYEDVERMLIAAPLVPPGSYATVKELGYFMLGGPNVFQVTCDISGPRATTGEVLEWAAVRASDLETLDADRVIPDVTLSSTYTIASTTTTVAINPNVFSRTGYQSGKYCYRLIIGSTATSFAFGLANHGKRSGFSALGMDTTTDPHGNSIAVYRQGSPQAGFVTYQGNLTGETGDVFFPNSDILVAVDVGARLFWYKTGTGASWNANPSANPATGVGGFNIQFPGTVYAAGLLNGAGSSLRFDFYPDVATLPSGFLQWGATPKFSIDTATFEALDVVQPATIGHFLGENDSTTFADMFAQLTSGIGGWFDFSPLGLLQVYRFDAPETFSLYDYDTHGGSILEIQRASLPNGLDPPPQRWRCKYQRNYTVMTELAGQVTEVDPELADVLRSEAQLASTSDINAAAVIAIWPDAVDTDPVESFFVLQTDAQDEADRLWTLYSQGLYQAYSMSLANASFVHQIGEVIKVTDTRLGLSSGKYLRIVSLSDDISNMTTNVVAFG